MKVPALPRPPLILAAAALLGLFVALLAVDPALAAKADVSKAGDNIAKTLAKWSAALFGGITGIMAIYFLLQRKIGPALGFVGLAMVVGAFVFSPDLVGGAAEDIAKTTLSGK